MWVLIADEMWACGGTCAFVAGFEDKPSRAQLCAVVDNLLESQADKILSVGCVMAHNNSVRYSLRAVVPGEVYWRATPLKRK